MNDTEVITLLWSGGWDSTFRILQLAIIEKKRVQPVYVYDKRRKSRYYELHAIHNVLAGLLKDFPESSQRIQPLKMINKSGLRKYGDLTRYFARLDQTYRLGIQYLWFARLCRQHKIDKLEICFVRHDVDTTPEFNRLLEKHVEGTGHDCRIKTFPENGYLEMFRAFRFPTLHISKIEMGKTALQYGFHHLLVMSWYCFNPTPDGSPCGVCRPCQLAVNSGNQYSLNPGIHKPPARSFLYRIFNNLLR